MKPVMTEMARRSIARFSAPFKVVMNTYPWGISPRLYDAYDRSVGYISLTGNSKQRRQQKRALLRYLNGV